MSCIGRLGATAVLLAFSSLSAPPQAHAGTPYEAQIGGFMTAALQTLITGEFAGRSPSNADAALNRPVCRPSDYDDLRAAANDRATFDAFHRRCKLVEGKIDETHVHSTAYLPHGYCETLKTAFETAMNKHRTTGLIEYKGARSQVPGNWAQLQATCREDGSLQISAPRKQRSP